MKPVVLGKAAKNTVTKLRMILKEVLTEAADIDLIDVKLILNWKKIKLPELKEAVERRALTQTENSAAHWVGYNHPEGFYLLVLFHLGLRRGEALALKWGDFDLVNRIVYIQRDLDLHVMKHDGHLDKEKAQAAQLSVDKVDRIGKLKTRAGKRVVPIFDPEFHEYLLKKQGGDNGYLFVGKKSGEPLSGPALSACGFDL